MLPSQNISLKYLDKSDKELDDLLHIISHDLRAPLRHIREFSRVLVDSIEQPCADQTLYGEFIQKASEKLECMIEGLISVSKLHVDRQANQTIDLNTLMDDILERSDLPVKEKLAAFVTVDKLPTIQGNPYQIRLLFFHLLKNALTHTVENRKTAITIRSKSSATSSIISISDNSAGIPDNLHDAIFAIFYKIDPSKSDDEAGIGLYIAKKIAELHQGEIHLESTLNEGSTFSVELPNITQCV